MPMRLARLLLVLLAVATSTTACIVVPYHAARVYGPPPPVYAPPPPVYAPVPCRWVWGYGRWECR